MSEAAAAETKQVVAAKIAKRRKNQPLVMKNITVFFPPLHIPL